MKSTVAFLLLILVITSYSNPVDDKVAELTIQRDYWHNKWKQAMLNWQECETKLNNCAAE